MKTDLALIRKALQKRAASGSEPSAKRVQTTSASAPPKPPTRVTPTPSERPSSEDGPWVGTQPNPKMEIDSPIRLSSNTPSSPQPSLVARVSQSSSSPPVSPALESNIYIPKWSVKASDSGINNAQVAKELARAILLPEDKKAFRRWQVNDLVEDAYKSVIRHADIICLMHDVLMALGHLVTKTEEKLKVVEHKSPEIEANLKANLQEAGEKLKAATEKLDAMEARAAVAKSMAEIAERRLIEAKKRIQEAEQRAAMAEEKAARAEEKAAQAVEIYLASEEFKQGITEGAADSFMLGFQDCRAQVERLLPEADLSSLRPLS